MGTHLRADSEPRKTRAEYWRDQIVSNVIGVDLRYDDPWDVRSEMRAGDIGAVSVTEVKCSSGDARRTPRHIRQYDPSRYVLMMQVGGATDSEHRGSCTQFAPGDLGLVDFSYSMQWRYSERHIVLLSFPKALSPLRDREMARLTGIRMSGTTGTGALVSSLVRQLPDHLDDGEGATGARIGSAVLDLMNAGFATRLDCENVLPSEVRTRSLLLRCQSFIEQHLAEVDLNPPTVAAAHHISLRYLHRVFEPTGEGVAALIRRRRLDRCRRDLLDPDLADRPVSAIGARWGITNSAHFNRAFKSVFGLPPAEFRATFGWSSHAASSDA
jgi:AraC-like DNA-binding protein